MKRSTYFPETSICPGGGHEAMPRQVRIHKRTQKIRDMGMRALNKQQRQALKNYSNMGAIPEVKKAAAIEARYSEGYALKAMDGLLQSRAIVKALEKAGGTDERIAEVMVEGLESEHPLKPGRLDPHAIHKFVTEANKVKGNYAPTKIQAEVKSQVMVVHMTAGNVDNFNKFKKMREAHGA